MHMYRDRPGTQGHTHTHAYSHRRPNTHYPTPKPLSPVTATSASLPPGSRASLLLPFYKPIFHRNDPNPSLKFGILITRGQKYM